MLEGLSGATVNQGDSVMSRNSLLSVDCLNVFDVLNCVWVQNCCYIFNLWLHESFVEDALESLLMHSVVDMTVSQQEFIDINCRPYLLVFSVWAYKVNNVVDVRPLYLAFLSVSLERGGCCPLHCWSLCFGNPDSSH